LTQIKLLFSPTIEEMMHQFKWIMENVGQLIARGEDGKMTNDISEHSPIVRNGGVRYDEDIKHIQVRELRFRQERIVY